MLQGKYIWSALLVLASLSSTNSLQAQSYQTAIDLNISQTKFNGFDDKDTDTSLTVTHNFAPVVAPNGGPLDQRAFLAKSSSISGTFGQNKPDMGETSKSYSLNLRYVTSTDLFFQLSYARPDTDRSFNSVTALLGKYLDDRTTASVSLRSFQSESGTADSKTLRAGYGKLIDIAAPNTFFAYGFGIGYRDSDFDANTGYRLDTRGIFYPSTRSSVGISLFYGSADSSVTSARLFGGYYVTDSLRGGLYLSKSLSNTDENQDVDTIGINLAALF